ncbi:MAG TPA: cytochrome c oxidase subunit 3 [Candidatus Binatia bacterium]|nr:cytochrome c oxidase subunit 3 [Candidatus Binatia bacterium]
MSRLVLEAPPRRRPDDRPPTRRRPDGGTPPPPPPTGGGDDDGEQAPRRLDNVRVAMLFLIAGEVMFFAAFVSGFFVLRMAAPLWPPPLQPRLPVLVTGFNTLVLLVSSLAMAGASSALRARDRQRLLRGLAIAAVLGALFLAIQGYEWMRLIHYGLTVSSGAYGATFYTLIGAHAAHVVGALVWLGVTLVLAARGRFLDGRTAVARACAIYWHFVVALWPVLYVSVYLV